VGRRDIRNLLIELRRQGKTIFLNSHLLSELEMVCDRVAILIEGLVARQGTLRELTHHTVDYKIVITASVPSLSERLRSAGAALEGNSVAVPGHDLAQVNEVIDMLRKNGVTIESVTPHRFSLEDILVEAIGKGTAFQK